jgi:hypothetical protein
MARACLLHRHGEALARAPGRHARPHPGPRPLRLVLGLLAVVALVFAATLMPAVALAEEEDGASDTSGTEGTGGAGGAGSGGPESAGDYGEGGYAEGYGANSPGQSGTEGPAASPGYTSPTQHEGIPPGPSAPPYSGNPYGPNPTSVPNMDVLCCPGPGGTSGPGGNTGDFGQHESDE